MRQGAVGDKHAASAQVKLGETLEADVTQLVRTREQALAVKQEQRKLAPVLIGLHGRKTRADLPLVS